VGSGDWVKILVVFGDRLFVNGWVVVCEIVCFVGGEGVGPNVDYPLVGRGRGDDFFGAGLPGGDAGRFVFKFAKRVNSV